MIYKKLLILSAVAVVSYATTNFNFVNSHANYGFPPNVSLSYYNVDDGFGGRNWRLERWGINTLNPNYLRTGTSPNFIYTTNPNFDYLNVLPDGLTLKIVSSNDNVGNFVSSNIPNTYIPKAVSIGSSSGRVFIELNNNSNKDYDLFLDYDGSVQQGWKWLVNDNQYYDGHFQEEFLLQTEFSYNGFVKLPLLSYSKLVVENINPDVVRFNGFHIRLIGDSVATTNAYNDGYQDGLTNGMSALPIQNLFTAIFGGVAAIFNVNIFGAISLGTIILAPIAVSLLWFILGIISGVGGKK
jgi:hypothetical protein